MGEEPKEKDGKGQNPDDDNNDDDTKVIVKKKKIEIKVDREPEITALQEELAELKLKRETEQKAHDEALQKAEGEKTQLMEDLDEKKSVLATQALEAFEKEKAEIVELCKNSGLTDEQIEEVETRLDSPTKLETVKGLVNLLVAGLKQQGGDDDGEKKEGDDKTGDGKKTPVVAGKAQINIPEGAKKWEDGRKLVDKLYDTAYYNPDVTPEERISAKKKIDVLIEALITGKSWKSLRDGKRFPLGIVADCPRCHHIYVGEIPPNCENCKYDLGSVRREL